MTLGARELGYQVLRGWRELDLLGVRAEGGGVVARKG